MNIRRAIRLLIANPLTTVALAAALYLDLRSLPGDYPQGGISTCGRAYSRLHGGPRYPLNYLPASSQTSIVRIGGQLRLLNTHRSEWGQAAVVLHKNPQDSGALSFAAIGSGRGFWAITRIEETIAVQSQFGSNFTPEDQRRARELYVDQVIARQQIGAPVWTAVLRTRDLTNTVPIYLGYLHNAAAASGLLVLLLSLSWITRIPATARQLRATSRVRRNRCPHCGYSRVGLASDSACPECGITPQSGMLP